ncbi:MAG: hypothetical protein J0I29_06310 [Rhizobiales bacterium]|nr:hypothetical protein [Hyphomicrobiales bacterium]
MSLDILVPVLMCVALLWWFGRGMSLRAMLITTVVTLVLIAAVLAVTGGLNR